MDKIKRLFKPIRQSQYDFDEPKVKAQLLKLFSDNTVCHLSHPFGDVIGPENFYTKCLAPLFHSMPDLERRDHIVISGVTDQGDHWIGCCGFYNGTFLKPFLNIPPTGHLAHMRFHEFYRFEGNKIVELQSIWDIPELMFQANAWPMAPSLGKEWCVPGPATMDGLVDETRPVGESQKALKIVLNMANDMKRHRKSKYVST